ncbi:hypothetical protein T439DRAFT_361056 [Meredithblackwellia eburnea MCA 4105]
MVNPGEFIIKQAWPYSHQRHADAADLSNPFVAEHRLADGAHTLVKQWLRRGGLCLGEDYLELVRDSTCLEWSELGDAFAKNFHKECQAVQQEYLILKENRAAETIGLVTPSPNERMKRQGQWFLKVEEMKPMISKRRVEEVVWFPYEVKMEVFITCDPHAKPEKTSRRSWIGWMGW